MNSTLNNIILNKFIIFYNFIIKSIFNIYYKFYKNNDFFIIPKYIQDTQYSINHKHFDYFLDKYQYKVYTSPDLEMGFSPFSEYYSSSISPSSIQTNKLRIRIPNHNSCFQYIK